MHANKQTWLQSYGIDKHAGEQKQYLPVVAVARQKLHHSQQLPDTVAFSARIFLFETLKNNWQPGFPRRSSPPCEEGYRRGKIREGKRGKRRKRAETEEGLV